MNVLDEIIAIKKKEVALNREKVSMTELCNKSEFLKKTKSLASAVRNGTGIIAEFKHKSPSAGKIENGLSFSEVLTIYEKRNVSGLSILTDAHYFGGDIKDLLAASERNIAPVLRKDFIIDEYQIFEAKANGADAILLIAEVLDEYHAKYLTTIAKSLELDVLMEFHGAEELHKLNENVDIIGVNNRNLKTLKTDIRTSFDLIKRLPFDAVKIAESGISSQYEIQELLKVGFQGFLIGESILKNSGLLASFNETIQQFKTIYHAS